MEILVKEKGNCLIIVFPLPSTAYMYMYAFVPEYYVKGVNCTGLHHLALRYLFETLLCLYWTLSIIGKHVNFTTSAVYNDFQLSLQVLIIILIAKITCFREMYM